VSVFNILTHTVENVNELVEVSATYSADIFTDIAGMPGVFLGHLTLLGTADFTYFGRIPSENPLGTFATELTDFSFQGTLNNNTFEVKKDPGKASTGSTTILQVGFEPPTYEVSGSLEIFALYSFNSSPFMTAPPRTADLVPAPVPIPEPGLGVLAGSLLVAVIVTSHRRRVR
jgi:hypothetical protein